MIRENKKKMHGKTVGAGPESQKRSGSACVGGSLPSPRRPPSTHRLMGQGHSPFWPFLSQRQHRATGTSSLRLCTCNLLPNHRVPGTPRCPQHYLGVPTAPEGSLRAGLMPTVRTLTPCLTVCTWDPGEVPSWPSNRIMEGGGGGQQPRAPGTCPHTRPHRHALLRSQPLESVRPEVAAPGGEGAYLDTDPVQ